MSEASPDAGEGGIAICGFAGRFPGADGVDRFWRNLCDGVESISRFSDEELRAAGEDEAKLADAAYVRARPILDDVTRFDAPFFGFSPREAEFLGPQQRLFLECAWEALEDGGCDPEQYPGAIGVFAGASLSTYLVRNLYGNRPALDAFGDVRATILNVPDSLATLTAYRLGLRGPCVGVQTFCSTSLVAVHLACQSLLAYESDVVLAGGSSVYVPQRSGYLYQEGDIVSPDGCCRAFDARAGGTVFGSGVAVVVLKRLADALADRDRVRAVIRGSAVNNDGERKASYAAPGVSGQAQVVVEALAAAGVGADSIGYVEMHGTGTLLGDPVEVSALTKAFRRTSSRRGFCAIGSVKTNVGHLDAAAGATSLIKAALCVESGRIPPSLHFETPNPEIDFQGSPFFVNTALREWTTGGTPRRAGVSSFGVGGTNAHVVLEEAPSLPSAEAGREAQLLVLSGKTQSAVDQAALRLAARLREQPELALADVAWTLQAGRRALDHRWAAVCTTVADAVCLLEGAESPRIRRGAPGRAHPKVAFCFAGGPQPQPGAGRLLYESEPAFRETIALCAAAAKPLLGADLCTLLFPVAEAVEDAVVALEEPAAGAAALFALEYAQARLWRGWGVAPAAMSGAGVGELVAACVRDEMSLETAVCRAIEQARRVGGAANETMAAAPRGPEATARGSEGTVLLLGPDPGDPARALDILGGLWVSGFQADWVGVHAPGRPRRVGLPTYPFERQRYWVEPEEEAAKAALPEKPAPTADVSSWLHEAVWKTSVLSSQESSRPAGRWLVFTDELGLGQALVALLAPAAQQVITVAPGTRFEGDPQAGYHVRPSEAADYVALVDDLRRRDALAEHVVHLWSVDPVGKAPDPLVAAGERGFSSLLLLVQALGRPPGVGRVEVVAVSSGLQDVTGSEPLSPEKAPLLGLCVVAPQEYHELSCRSIDVDLSAGEPRALAEILAREITSGALDVVVAWRGSKRWTRSVEPVPPRSAAVASPAVLPWDTYLVTGGLGNIGFVSALAIARGRRGAKLALLSRSPLPDRETWDAWLQAHADVDPISLRLRRVRALEAEGAEVLPLTADVADEEALRRALGESAARIGPIQCVVHAAGILGSEDFEPLQQLSQEACERVQRAKVRGLVNLTRVLQPAPELWLLTSSLSAVLGGVGYAAYAGANVFLDHFALEQNRRGRGRWLSVGFDRWNLGGASVREGMAGGEDTVGSIGVQEGYRVLEHLLRAGFSGNVVVSTAPLAERLTRWVGLEPSAGPAKATARAESAPSLRPRPELPTPYVAPRDEHEREVVVFFESLLGVGPIGVSDDFFALGGHSLFAARALSRLRATFGVSLPLSAFFEAPTAAALATRIGAVLAARDGAGNAGSRAREGRVEIEI
jgi:acyl transferase domain-containing protein